MTSRFKTHLLLTVALSLAALPAAAQTTTFPDDVFIEGDLKIQVPASGGGNPNAGGLYVEAQSILDSTVCMGNACSENESIPNETVLRLKYTNVNIEFEDTSSSTSPDRDWTLRVNDSNSIATGGIERFSIQDRTAGTIPFTLEGGAPENTLWLNDNGDIGFGTAFPGADLHVIDGTGTAGLRLEAQSLSADWEIEAGAEGLFIRDRDANTFPVVLENDAPSNAIRVKSTGNIGLGTNAPEGKLHTKGPGVQLAYFESSDGNAVQVRFRTDSENRRFLAVNNANEVKSQIIFKDNEILFTGATDSGANRWLTIGPSGILSQGGTCNVNPCDRTFDPDYFTVPPIEERAAYMWDNMHLPAIGPTTAGEPINLTEKTTGIIHELEVAHIYIEQLHEQLEAERAATKTELASVHAQIDVLARRLAEVENR